jgi:hypothetical protein
VQVVEHLLPTETSALRAANEQGKTKGA